MSNDNQELTPKPVMIISTPYQTGSAEETQLIKMLQACKLEPADYNIIQLPEDQVVSWHILRDQLDIRTIMLLGISPEQLGVSVQLMPHQVARFNDRNWIPTSSLPELMQYAEIKSHVWNYGLKPVFIDKVYG